MAGCLCANLTFLKISTSSAQIVSVERAESMEAELSNHPEKSPAFKTAHRMCDFAQRAPNPKAAASCPQCLSFRHPGFVSIFARKFFTDPTFGEMDIPLSTPERW